MKRKQRRQRWWLSGVLALILVAALAVKASAVPTIDIGPGSSPAGGYLPLSAFGIAAVAGVGDETIINFNVPTFLYAGQTWNRVGFVSNGYVVVGGGTAADVSITNQNLPNPAVPNNVLAPYWTDLDPAAGGSLRIGTLTDGADTWIVLDWDAVREFSIAGNRHSFEVWIGVTGDANPGEDISFAYGPNTGNGEGGFLTVGAEDVTGTVGDMEYFNGTGNLPVNGTQLRVTTRDLPVAVPLPSSLGLLVLGTVGMSLWRRRDF